MTAAAPNVPATPAAFYKMISIPEAQQTVLSHTRVLAPQALPLASILGRVLAEDVKSNEPLPPFPASIKARSCEGSCCVAQLLVACASSPRAPLCMAGGSALCILLAHASKVACCASCRQHAAICCHGVAGFCDLQPTALPARGRMAMR